MFSTAETIARVKAKFAWGLEHKTTPTLDFHELGVVLSELKRLHALDEERAKVVAVPKAMEKPPVIQEEIKPKTILRKS